MGNGLCSAFTTRGYEKEAPCCYPHLLPLSKTVKVPLTESDPVVSDQGDAPADSLIEVLLSLILQREIACVNRSPLGVLL